FADDLLHVGLDFPGSAAAAGASIDTDSISAATSQKLIDRHAVSLPLQVPQCDLDSADGRVADRSTRIARAVAHQAPQELDARGTLADGPVLEVMDNLVDGFVGPDTIGLADSVQMFVCQDLHENVIAGEMHGIREDVGDFHALLLVPVGLASTVSGPD